MTQDEFYEKIPEWVSKPKDTWNHITLMAYFCHKYEKVHGVRFRLVKWQTDPGKGRRAAIFLGSSKPWPQKIMPPYRHLRKRRKEPRLI